MIFSYTKYDGLIMNHRPIENIGRIVTSGGNSKPPLERKRLQLEKQRAAEQRAIAWETFQKNPIVIAATAQFPAESVVAQQYAWYLFRRSQGERPKLPAKVRKFRKVSPDLAAFSQLATIIPTPAGIQRRSNEYGGASPDSAVSLILTFFLLILAACTNVANEPASTIPPTESNPPALHEDEPETEKNEVILLPELGFIDSGNSTTFINPETGETISLEAINGNYYEKSKLITPNPDGSNTFVEYDLSVTRNENHVVFTSTSDYKVEISYTDDQAIVTVTYPNDGGTFSKTFDTRDSTYPQLLRKNDVQAKLDTTVVGVDPTEIAPDELNEDEADATAEAIKELPVTLSMGLEQGRELFPNPGTSEFFAAFRHQGVGEGFAQTGQLPTEYYYPSETSVSKSIVTEPTFTFNNIIYSDTGTIIYGDLTMHWTDSDGNSFELVWTSEAGWGTLQFEGKNTQVIQSLSTINPDDPSFYVEGNLQLMQNLGLDEKWNPNAQWWSDTFATHALTRTQSEIIINQEDGSSILDAQLLVFMATMVYEKIDISNEEILNLRTAIDSYNNAQNNQQREQEKVFAIGERQIDITKFVFGKHQIDLTKKGKIIIGGKPGGHSLLPNEPFVTEQDGSIIIHVLAPERVTALGQAFIAIFSSAIYDEYGFEPDVEDMVPIYRVFGDHSMGMVGEPGNRKVIFPILPK